MKKLLILFLAVFAFSCGNKKEGEFTFTDDIGEEVKLQGVPQRIVSMAPNITEGLYSIDADTLLVGVTNFCDYPPEATQKPKIGGLIDANYELITALRPDLVIMTVDANSKSSYQAVKNLGLNIYVVNPKNLDGIAKMIMNFGKITGRERNAGEVASRLLSERDSLRRVNMTTIDSLKSCLVVVSVNPLMTVSGKSFVNEIIELAGMENIYKNEGAEYPMASYEDVVMKNPQIIIFPTDTTDAENVKKYNDELIRQIPSVDAVKNNRIINADANVLFRPSPRIIEGVKILRRKKAEFQYK